MHEELSLQNHWNGLAARARRLDCDSRRAVRGSIGRKVARFSQHCARVRIGTSGSGASVSTSSAPSAMGGRTTEEKLRVAEALEGLPELARELREGTTSWSHGARAFAGGYARHQSAPGSTPRAAAPFREIEHRVAGHAPGDRPDDPCDASRRRPALRFEVSAETFATFGEAMTKLRRETGASLDDDAALLLLARRALEGPSDEGRANYQIAVTVCDACGRGWQEGRGERIEVGRRRGRSSSLRRATRGKRRGGRPRGRGRPARSAGCDPRGQEKGDAPRRGTLRGPGMSTGRVRRRAPRGCPRSEGGDHDPESLIVLCAAAPPGCSPRTARDRGSAVDGPRLSSRRWHAVRRRPFAQVTSRSTKRRFARFGRWDFEKERNRRGLETVRAGATVGKHHRSRPSTEGARRIEPEGANALSAPRRQGSNVRLRANATRSTRPQRATSGAGAAVK